MAFDRDRIFTHEFTGGNGWSYKLIMIPADTTALTTPLTETLLPSDIISKDTGFVVKRGFDDDRIAGLQLTDVMTFDIDLSSFHDKGSDDWTTVRDWIVQGQLGTVSLGAFTPTTKTINYDDSVPAYGNKDINLPNVWILLTDSGTGTMNRTEFIGVQDVRPSQTISIENGYATKTISLISIDRYVFELFDMYALSIIAETTDIPGKLKPDTIDYYTWNISSEQAFVSSIANQTILTFKKNNLWSYTFQSLLDAIFSDFPTNIYQSLLRNTTSTVSDQGDVFDSLKVYKTTQDTNLTKQAEITSPSNLYYAFNGFTIGDEGDRSSVGMFGGGEDNVYEYDNVWDLLKYWVDSFWNKCNIQYVITSLSDMKFDMYFVFQRIYKALNHSGGTISATSLTSSNFGSKIDFEENSMYVAQGITYIRDINETQDINDDESYEAPTEFTYYGNGILNEESEEIKVIFHNQLPVPNSDKTATYRDGNLLNIYTKTITRGIYYKPLGENKLRMISDYIQVDTGDGTIDPETSYDATDLPNMAQEISWGVKYPALIDWLNTRYGVSGMGYVFAKAGVEIYGNTFQAMISGAVKSESVSNIIGVEYTIDPNDLIEGTFLNPPYENTSAWSVSQENDIINGINKIKFWLPA